MFVLGKPFQYSVIEHSTVVGPSWVKSVVNEVFSGHNSYLYFFIRQDICSFGNPSIDKEHWLQIYPPLSFFDYLVVKLSTTVLAPSPILF